MSTTPNMVLTLPDVGVTLGPTYATENNAAFEIIDAHNHAPGSGSLIGTAGIRIDGDFDLASYNITGPRTLRLTDQTSISLVAADVRSIYVKSGDLFYRNATATEVQITSGGTVNTSTGNISGLASPASASFTTLTGTFAFLKDTGKPGKLAISEISLYEFNNATAAPIVIKSPASLAGTYTLTLPAALPSSTQYLAVTSSGTVVTSGGILLAAAGSVSIPSISFSGDPDTGVYNSAVNTVAIATGGARSASFTASAVTLDGRLLVDGGLVGAPGLSFTSDSDTGIYNPSGNILTIAAGGADAMLFRSTTLQAAMLGSSSTAAYSFSGDSDTGISAPSANMLSIITGGSTSASFVAGGLTFDGGSTTIRMVQVTGSVGPGATSSAISTPGAADIKGVFGAAISFPHGVEPIGTTSASPLYFTPVSSHQDQIKVVNTSGSLSYSYTVTLLY